MSWSSVGPWAWFVAVAAAALYHGLCMSRFRRAYRCVHPLPPGADLIDLFQGTWEEQHALTDPHGDPQVERQRRRAERSLVIVLIAMFGPALVAIVVANIW